MWLQSICIQKACLALIEYSKEVFMSEIHLIVKNTLFSVYDHVCFQH